MISFFIKKNGDFLKDLNINKIPLMYFLEIKFIFASVSINLE